MIKRLIVVGMALASFGLVTWQFGNSLADSQYRVALGTVDACYLGKGIDPDGPVPPPTVVQECTQAWRIYEDGHLSRFLTALAVGAVAASLFLALCAGAARLLSARAPAPRRAS